MIMVDVKVPSIGRTYNFNLDEHTPIFVLLAEIVEVVCQKESCHLDGDAESLVLCSMDLGKILPSEKSLSQCGIQPGSRLMLA